MSNADGERIAPVTYLFGAKTELEDVGETSPSAHATPPGNVVHSGPVFEDLGAPEIAEPSARAEPFARAEAVREARAHIERDTAAAKEPRKGEPRKGKGSFAPISNVSMHALARRGMSSSEMRDYLVGRDFDATEVEVEIDRLEQVGLLDDVALGETLVRTLRERKGLGRSALNAELRRRKLDPDAIGASLETLEDDELDRALALAVKRAPQLRVHDRDTAKRRLVAFLMRKGYSGSTSASAADRVLTGGYGSSDEPARTGPVFR